MNSQHLNELSAKLEELRHLLPVQGPIDVFIHHNTLHSFEHLDFEQAVEQASTIYKAQPYLSELRYRELFHDGVIEETDIELELTAHLGADAPLDHLPLTRHSFRRKLLFFGLLGQGEAVSLWKQNEARLRLRSDLPTNLRRSLIKDTRQWVISQHGAGNDAFLKALYPLGRSDPKISRGELARFIHGSDQSRAAEKRAETITASILWQCAHNLTTQLQIPDEPLAPHHAEALVAITGQDLFDLVNPVMIQLCSMFVDQGVSHWPLPGREQGLLAAAQALFRQRGMPTEPWLKRAESLFRLVDTSQELRKTLVDTLDKLEVPSDAHGDFIIHGALKLKGWAGIISLLESKPQIVRDRPVRASLDEFLIVQNLLVLAAVQELVSVARIGSVGLKTLQTMAQARSREHYVALERQRMTGTIFEVAQLAGLSPTDLIAGGVALARTAFDEVAAFPETLRRRIWHLAYERSYLRSVLSAFGNHKAVSFSPQQVEAQVVFCIDEREESLRRHLEEIDPHIETLGYPGFFNLPLAYRGIHHLHAEALCPVVMEPQIIVTEHDRQSRAGHTDNFFKRLLGATGRELQSLSRTAVGGSVLSATLGHFALIPFLTRVLQPALAGRVHDAFHTPEIKESDFKVSSAESTVVDEALRKVIAQSLTAVIQTIGIAHRLSPLLVIMGHGSSSLNNPHESAHDCGACGGRRGAPSGRLFARFANDPLIRAEMRKLGLDLPEQTYVVGAYHDTCDDSITLFDEHLIPQSHRELVQKVINHCRKASARNAVERSRRFLTSRRNLSPERAAMALLRRAEDFSEPRPEYGHATNAMAFIGRRERCKGLFLDRRAFLSSYDAREDPQGKTLQALLSAVIPVCAGINLEYYFSMVDSAAYGCGTKLPHNIVGQIGVMDGSASDLRTGLPWQMVEIHEPVRLVMMVEASPEIVQQILDRLPKIKTLVENRWIWLVVVHPERANFWLYGSGEFHPYRVDAHPLPTITDSLSYCVHTSQPLPFASVASSSEATVFG